MSSQDNSTESNNTQEEVTAELKPAKKKTGNKPKELIEGTYLGYEVGRGMTKKVVDPEEVYKLAAKGMKTTEIAEWFGIPENTLRYNFRDYLAKGRLELNQSLRMAQIQLALSGNATMLIFLGKVILGQREDGYSSDENQPLPWTSE